MPASSNLLTVVHPNRLRRATGLNKDQTLSLFLSDVLSADRNQATKAKRAARFTAAPYTSCPVSKRQVTSISHQCFVCQVHNLPLSPTFPSKLTTISHFFLFSCRYVYLSRKQVVQVTLNSMPPVDFTGCRIRIPEVNVF